MRKFVNTYIYFFLLDGLVSLAAALFGRVIESQTLTIIQACIAFVVFAMSFPLYFLIGCVRGLPKRVILPMVLFTAWASLFFSLPIPIFLGIENTILFLSIAQTCLAVAALLLLRFSSDNKQWAYSRLDFEEVTLRWKRLVGFIAANVILVIPALAVCLALSLSLAVSHLSSGFAHLGWTGVSVEARTYLHEGKTILLLPTAHIAKPRFYEELVEPLSTENTVVILEGVTDKERLLKEPLDHGKIARRLGLEAQDNRVIVADRKTKLCDVDISEFSSDTLDYLRAYISLSGHWASGDLTQALLSAFSIPQPDFDQLREDLLDKRNQKVVEAVAECAQTYDQIVVPWGVAHMPGIESALMNQGAALLETRRVPLWSWSF